MQYIYLRNKLEHFDFDFASVWQGVKVSNKITQPKIGMFPLSEHMHTIYVDCLLCFSSGKYDEYRGRWNMWENIDYIVMIITQVLVMIYQQRNKDKSEKTATKTSPSIDLVTYF